MGRVRDRTGLVASRCEHLVLSVDKEWDPSRLGKVRDIASPQHHCVMSILWVGTGDRLGSVST